jgi:hypothetical protein
MLFVEHVLIMALWPLYVQPIVRPVSFLAYRYFLLLAMVSHGYKVRTQDTPLDIIALAAAFPVSRGLLACGCRQIGLCCNRKACMLSSPLKSMSLGAQGVAGSRRASAEAVSGCCQALAHADVADDGLSVRDDSGSLRRPEVRSLAATFACCG